MATELPIGLYQKTTSHFKNGKVISVYCKIQGQGPKLILNQDSDTAELGAEFSLVLQPVAEVAPPIGITPEFPEFPTPETPITTVPPIGVVPPTGITPGLPTPPVPPAGVTPELPGGTATLPGEITESNPEPK